MNCVIFTGILTLAFGGLLVPVIGNLFKLSKNWILNIYLIVFLLAGILFAYGTGTGHLLFPNLFSTMIKNIFIFTFSS